ncbi:7 transmembrane receptor (rhodopsin family) domain-containing protein [Ditylenchus destructor]|uniref:7 transmembrane receptor (Rhodopsin family) domain-containing protein n=1 Tax=Ditylenchus destructor TaxID=166010 RepID=A0AAD4QTD1_9BILA|nr:7 transmembrane receptor (rhodopsin family) domain-containing protein [Ditylenchus destructor]
MATARRLMRHVMLKPFHHIMVTNYVPSFNLRSTCSDHITSSTGHQSLTNLDGRRNVVKMLIICVLVFYISYTPLAVFYVWGAIFNVRMEVPFEFEFAALLLVLFSSALNPFLYTLFSRTFRDRLFCICRRVLSRKSTTETTLVNGSL